MMKRLVSFFFIGFLLVGCQQDSANVNHDIPDYEPTAENIVDTHGDIENLSRFKKFIANVEAGQADQIRVVRYTTEGDAMLHDLIYDGESITSTTDTRRDQYGSGNITTTTCDSIVIKQKDDRTDYVLQGCKEQIDTLVLAVWK